jgi:5'-deoxynucleotidase YfbR-like HD superfamily hydrolase
MEESEKVADVVKNLVKHPEQYKKDFEEYIGYKTEK